MRHIALIIGDDLRINSEFLSYILSEYESNFGEMADISFASKNSKELPAIIEKISNEYEAVTIFGSNEAYSVVAKILATLSDDSLILNPPSTLALSRAISVSNGSFLINLNKAQINLVHTSATESINKLLISPERDFSYFCLFDIDADSASVLLEPLAKSYGVNFIITQMIPAITLVRAQANKFGQLQGFLQGASTLFSQKIINDRDFVKFIAQRLIERDLKISFAESCTAGLCAAKFARYGGISAVFDGSLVTYANEMKRSWLRVSKDTLKTYGAVSDQCVHSMLTGTINATNADFALAVSGIAGPDGGSDEKPVGTIYVGAMAKDKKVFIERLLLKGDRNYIREQSALSAFACLLRLKSEIFFS